MLQNTSSSKILFPNNFPETHKEMHKKLNKKFAFGEKIDAQQRKGIVNNDNICKWIVEGPI